MKPNNQTAAICGLFCGTCPCYPQECHGCLSDKLQADCVDCVSGFRECAKHHQVERCYQCSDFPCDRLVSFSKRHVVNGICHHQNVINDLIAMRDNGVEAWVKQKSQEATCLKCGELIVWYEKESHCCSK